MIDFNKYNINDIPVGTIIYCTTSFRNDLWVNLLKNGDWHHLVRGKSLPVSKYPELAKAKPEWISNSDVIIPELRSRYLRIAGDESGERGNGKFQGDAIREIYGSFGGDELTIRASGGTSGCFKGYRFSDGISWASAGSQRTNDNDGVIFRASNYVPTADEVRPMSYCVEAYIRVSTKYQKEQTRNFFRDLAFPVGSIWTTTIDPLQPDGKPHDPNELLGGTWEIWNEAKGRVLVQVNRDDPEIAYTKMQAGKKLHQLSVKELPAHSHGIASPEMQWPAIAKNQALSGYEVQGTQLTGSKTEPTGESVPFSLMQPSISVIYWIRTA